MEFKLKEQAVEVCEHFVSTNWKGELAVMLGKIWVYETTDEICEITLCVRIF